MSGAVPIRVVFLQLGRRVLVGMIAQTCLRLRAHGYRAAVLSGTSAAFVGQ